MGGQIFGTHFFPESAGYVTTLVHQGYYWVTLVIEDVTGDDGLSCIVVMTFAIIQFPFANSRGK